MADAAAHLLQDSDWELGDRTREGKTLTDAGEYVGRAVGAFWVTRPRARPA